MHYNAEILLDVPKWEDIPVPKWEDTPVPKWEDIPEPKVVVCDNPENCCG